MVEKEVIEKLRNVVASENENSPKEIVSEISDAVYYIMKIMNSKGIKVEDIYEEFEKKYENIPNRTILREKMAGIH